VVLEASVLEIDIDELRVAASRLADVEFRLCIVLANCECFLRDICGLTGSIPCMKYASKELLLVLNCCGGVPRKVKDRCSAAVRLTEKSLYRF
jgi:hypothetical protein